MPIHERDPWRLQYFAAVECPRDVHIPTDDIDAYCFNRAHRWLYNKLLVAESQGIECGPHGIAPREFPVFAKPIYNLRGMGVDSRVVATSEDYERYVHPGQMWMRLLTGDHVSTDAAVVRGNVRWIRNSVGVPLPGGTFDYWVVESRPRAELEAYCTEWVARHVPAYTGMINLETIGGRIIEAHLRFSDQWPDLYGADWLSAVVRLYSRGSWELIEAPRVAGYSVVLFGPHDRHYRHPAAEVVDRLRAYLGISSVQITFSEAIEPAHHAMPPGGFRLAIVNTSDFGSGIAARRMLANAFGVDAPDSDHEP